MPSNVRSRCTTRCGMRSVAKNSLRPIIAEIAENDVPTAERIMRQLTRFRLVDQRCACRKSHPTWRKCTNGAPSHRDDRSFESARRLARRPVQIARCSRRQQLRILKAVRISKAQAAPCGSADLCLVLPLFPSLLGSAVISKLATLVRWHRSGFRLYWRWKSRRRIGRTAVAADIPACFITPPASPPLICSSFRPAGSNFSTGTAYTPPVPRLTRSFNRASSLPCVSLSPACGLIRAPASISASAAS
jgi:hypothetical protein